VALAELACTSFLQAAVLAESEGRPTPALPAACAASSALARRRPVTDAMLAGAEALLTAARALQLAWLFSPLLLCAPVCLLYDLGRAAWMRWFHATLRRAGPAFIKWGQARRCLPSVPRSLSRAHSVGRHARGPLPAGHVRSAGESAERRALAQLCADKAHG
jgi:hypothetical protein